MRKHRLLPLLVLPSLLLAGCQERGNGGEPNGSSSSVTDTSENSLESEQQSASSLEDQAPVSYRWDKQTDALLAESLGEYASEVPVLNALFYDSVNFISEDESYVYTVISCYGDDSEKMMKLYKAGLSLNGYSVTYNAENRSYGTYARIDFTKLLMLTFMDMQDAGGTDSGVVLCAWIYQDKTTDFPMQLVEDFVHSTIPAPEAQYYQGQRMDDYGIVCVNCYGTSIPQAETFVSELRKAGFEEDVAQGAVYGGTYFVHPTKDIGLNYYYYTAEQAAEEGFEGNMPVLMLVIYEYTISDDTVSE